MIYEKSGCSMPSNRYLSAFEYMFVFSKGAPSTFNPIEDRKNRFPERWGQGRKVRNKDGSFGHRKKYKAKEYGRRFNIWRYTQGGGYSTKDDIAYEHPAIFPERLAGDHIKSWSNRGDLVYDPFGGSGTTAKMAHLLGGKWIMSEISEEYCALANKRLEPYLKQARLL
jgi:site-specific DNA-methyltransferase (adenine-specific)